jgi:hypothetical protein
MKMRWPLPFAFTLPNGFHRRPLLGAGFHSLAHGSPSDLFTSSSRLLSVLAHLYLLGATWTKKTAGWAYRKIKILVRQQLSTVVGTGSSWPRNGPSKSIAPSLLRTTSNPVNAPSMAFSEGLRLRGPLAVSAAATMLVVSLRGNFLRAVRTGLGTIRC